MAKGKDPAFLFYSQDFIVGVQTMDWEDRGKYITILCMMHQKGRLDEKTISFLVGYVSDNLKSKFFIDDNGFWYNVKLESEMEKRAKFTESRVNNGKLGGRPAKNSKPSDNLSVSVSKASENLIENEDENINIDSNNNNSLFKDTLLKNENWKKTISTEFEITLEEVVLKLDKFHKHLSTELKVHPSMNEFAKHFKYWLPVNKEKNGKSKTNTRIPAASFSKNR